MNQGATKDELDKIDRLSYLSLFFAIHGYDDKAEKMRAALRRIKERIVVSPKAV